MPVAYLCASNMQAAAEPDSHVTVGASCAVPLSDWRSALHISSAAPPAAIEAQRSVPTALVISLCLDHLLVHGSQVSQHTANPVDFLKGVTKFLFMPLIGTGFPTPGTARFRLPGLEDF